MNNATSPRSNFSAMLFIYLFPFSPLLRLTTLRMKSGHRIAVTAMSNISFCQLWLLSPPPHLMSLYSPEGAVGMKGRGLAADLRGRRVLKDGSEREGEGKDGGREKEREQSFLLRGSYLGWQAKAGLQTPFVKRVEKKRASSSLELRQCWVCHPWGVSRWEREELVVVRGSLWALQMLK